VALDMLQLSDSLKLCAPTISMGAFVKAVDDCAWHTNLQQVRLVCARFSPVYRCSSGGRPVIAVALKACCEAHMQPHQSAATP